MLLWSFFSEYCLKFEMLLLIGIALGYKAAAEYLLTTF